MRAFGFCGHQRGVLIDEAALGAEHLGPEAALELHPFAPVAAEFAHRMDGIERLEPRREAIGHGHIVEHRQHQREAFMREAFDGETGDEALADFGRIAGPQLLAADDGVEIHGAGRNVQAAQLAGQAEMQIVDEFVLQMRLAISVGEIEAAHAAQAEQVAERVLDIAQHPLETLDLALAGRYRRRGRRRRHR